MKVRILSGNAAGMIEEMEQVNAEVAIATGFAAAYVEPATDAGDTIAEAVAAPRKRSQKGKSATVTDSTPGATSASATSSEVVKAEVPGLPSAADLNAVVADAAAASATDTK